VAASAVKRAAGVRRTELRAGPRPERFLGDGVSAKVLAAHAAQDPVVPTHGGDHIVRRHAGGGVEEAGTEGLRRLIVGPQNPSTLFGNAYVIQARRVASLYDRSA